MLVARAGFEPATGDVVAKDKACHVLTVRHSAGNHLVVASST